MQAFYNKEAGTKALTTETGAGQWGSVLAMACNFFGLELEVYMVKVSYTQKSNRRIIMESFGADVYASPTDRTNYGRSVLAQDPNSPGSLGIATSALATAAIAGASVMAYEAYHHGQLEDYEYPAEKMHEAMAHLPKVPAMA